MQMTTIYTIETKNLKKKKKRKKRRKEKGDEFNAGKNVGRALRKSKNVHAVLVYVKPENSCLQSIRSPAPLSALGASTINYLRPV